MGRTERETGCQGRLRGAVPSEGRRLGTRLPGRGTSACKARPPSSACAGRGDMADSVPGARGEEAGAGGVGGGAEKGPRALGALGARAAVGSVRTVGRRVPASPSRARRAKKQTCVWPVLGICSVCLRGRTEDRGFPGRRCLGGRGCGQHCARSLTSQSPVPEAARGVSPLGSRPASPTF